MSICKNQFIQKKYHIFQQTCNALLVNMLKAGRWLFYIPAIYQPSTSHLPAIYQHGTAHINWALTCYTLIVSFYSLCLLALRQQRCAYTYDEHGEDDTERSHGVNLHPLVNEHLHTDEE